MDEEGIDESFKKAVSDAQRLLHYASNRGIALSDEVIQPIVHAQEMIGRDTKNPATFQSQQLFWKALTQLSAATQPASTESLRYCTTTRVPFWDKVAWFKRWLGWNVLYTQAEVAVRRSAVKTLVCLFVLSVCQIYNHLSSTTYNGYYESKQIVAEKHRLIKTNQAALSAKGLNSEQAASLNAQIAEASEVVEDKKDSTIRNLQLMRQLMFWVNWQEKFKGVEDEYVRAQITLASMQGMLLILGDFCLPMLWGLLGASLYVSRALAEDIKASAYTAEKALVFQSRYYMGAVAGFVATRVISVTPGLEKNAIAPFVLAMVVGYSVEVLFSLLDKIIATFSSK